MLEEYHNILTTEELAQILRLNERTIIKLVKEGKLPAAKIANQFRFQKEKIIDWLESQMNTYSDSLLSEIEKGETEQSILIHRFLTPSNIALDIQATTKYDAIEEMVNLADRTGLVKNKVELVRLVKLREDLQSTALDKEIAVPHPRNASWELVNKFLIFVGVSKKGIDFEAFDNKAVKFLVMLAIPVLSFHLPILTRIARIFNDNQVRADILKAKSESDVIEIIKSKEEEFSVA